MWHICPTSSSSSSSSIYIYIYDSVFILGMHCFVFFVVTPDFVVFNWSNIVYRPSKDNLNNEVAGNINHKHDVCDETQHDWIWISTSTLCKGEMKTIHIHPPNIHSNKQQHSTLFLTRHLVLRFLMPLLSRNTKSCRCKISKSKNLPQNQ